MNFFRSLFGNRGYDPIKAWIKWVRSSSTHVVDDPIPDWMLRQDDFPSPDEPLTLRELLTRHGTVEYEINDPVNLDKEVSL